MEQKVKPTWDDEVFPAPLKTARQRVFEAMREQVMKHTSDVEALKQAEIALLKNWSHVVRGYPDICHGAVAHWAYLFLIPGNPWQSFMVFDGILPNNSSFIAVDLRRCVKKVVRAAVNRGIIEARKEVSPQEFIDRLHDQEEGWY